MKKVSVERTSSVPTSVVLRRTTMCENRYLPVTRRTHPFSRANCSKGAAVCGCVLDGSRATSSRQCVMVGGTAVGGLVGRARRVTGDVGRSGATATCCGAKRERACDVRRSWSPRPRGRYVWREGGSGRARTETTRTSCGGERELHTTARRAHLVRGPNFYASLSRGGGRSVAVTSSAASASASSSVCRWRTGRRSGGGGTHATRQPSRRTRAPGPPQLSARRWPCARQRVRARPTDLLMLDRKRCSRLTINSTMYKHAELWNFIVWSHIYILIIHNETENLTISPETVIHTEYYLKNISFIINVFLIIKMYTFDMLCIRIFNTFVLHLLCIVLNKRRLYTDI